MSSIMLPYGFEEAEGVRYMIPPRIMYVGRSSRTLSGGGVGSVVFWGSQKAGLREVTSNCRLMI